MQSFGVREGVARALRIKCFLSVAQETQIAVAGVRGAVCVPLWRLPCLCFKRFALPLHTSTPDICQFLLSLDGTRPIFIHVIAVRLSLEFLNPLTSHSSLST